VLALLDKFLHHPQGDAELLGDGVASVLALIIARQNPLPKVQMT
jgi:hypothetical protein